MRIEIKRDFYSSDRYHVTTVRDCYGEEISHTHNYRSHDEVIQIVSDHLKTEDDD